MRKRRKYRKEYFSFEHEAPFPPEGLFSGSLLRDLDWGPVDLWVLKVEQKDEEFLLKNGMISGRGGGTLARDINISQEVTRRDVIEGSKLGEDCRGNLFYACLILFKLVFGNP